MTYMSISSKGSGHHVQQGHFRSNHHHDQHGTNPRQCERRMEHHCVQRTFGLSQTAQTQQFHELVQQSSQASGHRPRPARVAAGVHAQRGHRPVWRRLQRGGQWASWWPNDFNQGNSLGGASAAASSSSPLQICHLHHREMLRIHFASVTPDLHGMCTNTGVTISTKNWLVLTRRINRRISCFYPFGGGALA